MTVANKKGFTLVELLAVIAILAILVIIALPAVLDIFNQSKKDAFVTQARSIYKNAEQQFLSDQINAVGSGSVSYCNGTSPTKQLKMSGNSSVKYNISIDAEGKVTSFKVSDGTFSITSSTSPYTVDSIQSVDTTYSAVTSCS